MLFLLLSQYWCFQNSEFNNTILYQNEGRVIYLINKGVISLYVLEQGRMLLKFNILRLHYVTHDCARIECNFLKQPWSNTRSKFCAIWENNIETLQKLFYMIQSRCSIYSHFLKPLHWNIHQLWHQALISNEDYSRRFRENS